MRRFVSWVSGNLEVGAVDPVVTGQPGPGHPLGRYVSDFLADLSNANVSARTLRALLGDLL